jgi:hypothetical protein
MTFMKRRVSYFIIIAVGAFSFAVSGCGRPAKETGVPEKKPPVAAEVKKEVAAEKPAAPAPAPAVREKVQELKPEKVLFSFEDGTQYWEMPDWAKEKTDHVAKSIEASKDYASHGASSLKVMADFPGKVWTAALVEYEEYLDWAPYKRVSCDIYVPASVPEGLKAKIILTVGEDWRFTEMSRVVFLMPGKWTTVSASLEPGSDDWKMMSIDDNFRKDVRKIAIRIESNKGPIYSGPIYIDNFRLSE